VTPYAPLVRTPAPASRPLAATGLGLLAAALFAVNGTVSKAVLESGLDDLHLVEIRCLGGALVFAAVAALRDPRSLRITRGELGFVVGYGVVGVALVQWLYFAAIGRMPVSVALLIEFTAPLLVALWHRFVLHRPVRPRVWAALALVLAGLALVAQVWSGLALDAAGVGFAFLAALSLAAYFLLGERAMTTRDELSLAAWGFAAAALLWALLLPWWRFPFGRLVADVTVGGAGVVPATHAPAWVLVIWVVLLGTVAPFALVLTVLRRIGATRTGLLGTTEPPLAGVVAWLVLGEVLTGIQLLGAVVVLAGIVLAETARGPVADPPPVPELSVP
jgi:drug/metabolite transporter (DMT)-like permease